MIFEEIAYIIQYDRIMCIPCEILKAQIVHPKVKEGWGSCLQNWLSRTWFHQFGLSLGKDFTSRVLSKTRLVRVHFANLNQQWTYGYPYIVIVHKNMYCIHFRKWSVYALFAFLM